MNDGSEAGPAATPDKSPNTDKPKSYQDRFQDAIEAWRKEGCPERTHSAEEAPEVCGKPPHRVKMSPKDSAGFHTMSVDCSAGHQNVWTFEVSAEEMQEDLEARAAADAKAHGEDGAVTARDPMKATLKITMDLKTQQVDIEPWVPTPGMGIQLAGILMAHFFAQMQATFSAAPAGGLVLPKKDLLDRNGKKIILS